MAQRDLLNRSLDAGKDVTQRTQERLETLVRDMAKAAEDQAGQAQRVVQELLERSRSTTEQLVEAIDRELRGQINAVGLATRADIVRLEKKIDGLQTKPGTSTSTGTATAKAPARTPAKKTAAKNAGANKSATKKAATKKAVAV